MNSIVRTSMKEREALFSNVAAKIGLSSAIVEFRGAKIKCARRHFAAIAPDDVKYEFVSTYKDLHTLLTSVAG